MYVYSTHLIHGLNIHNDHIFAPQAILFTYFDAIYCCLCGEIDPIHQTTHIQASQ